MDNFISINTFLFIYLLISLIYLDLYLYFYLYFYSIIPLFQRNRDLTFATVFNLAITFQNFGLYQEALNTYRALLKENHQRLGSRVRLNMAYIHMLQENHSQAIKMLRMLADELSPGYDNLKMKIYRNLGVCHLKMGQFADAVTALTTAFELEKDVQTCFNLLLAHYALGDVDEMKKTFEDMLNIRDPVRFVY